MRGYRARCQVEQGPANQGGNVLARVERVEVDHHDPLPRDQFAEVDCRARRPVVPPSERLTQVRETVTMLRELDGPDLHMPVGGGRALTEGPGARGRAADTVTFALMPGEARAEVEHRVRDFRAIRDVELSQHLAVIGDAVAPFMAPPDTNPAALRATDSLAILPDDPVAAAEEIQRRREEIGFSYFVFGADVSDALAPVLAELARI